MPLLDGPSLGGNARHVLRQYAEENALARGRGANAAGTEEFGGGCLRGRYNNLREVIQNNPSLVVVPSIINAGSLFVQRPICRTNYLPNNSMAGATGGVLPTNWSIASLPAGITVSYSASGTAVAADGTSVNYIDVTVSGTAGASGFLNIRPNPSPSTIAAFVGQSWNTSVYLQLISGSVASISPTWQLQELNSSQGFLQGSNITGLGSLVVGGQFDRYNVSRVLTDSATAFVTCRWGHSFVSGTTYSYTLRIGSPQLERFSVPTPMIATSTGAVTRLNESTNVVGLPPDFTVSRNTGATRVGPNGLIETGNTNLALQSEAWNVSPWVATSGSQGATVSGNVTTSPDGTTNADKLIEAATAGTHICTQTITLTSGTTYTASFFAKAGERTLGRLRMSGSTAYWDLEFNLTSGTASGATNTFIQNYGNGWYRIGATFTANQASNNFIIFMRDASGNTSYTGNGTNGFFVWGAQLEVGSTASEYIPTTTVARTRFAGVTVDGTIAANIPRIDWLGQSCPGLLVEASGQNLVPNGVGFNSATGVQTSSVTDSPAAAISGTLCTKNEASGTIRYVNQTVSNSALSPNTTYTVSRFFKYNGVDFTTTLEFNNSFQWGGVSWSQDIVLSLASGVTLGTSTSCTGSIDNFGNGWYRVNVRITTGAVMGGGATVSVLSRLPASLSTGQGFLTACPQLEVGSVATTYIPTTTAAVSRAADVISASGALVSGLIGQTEGTIYAEIDFRNLVGSPRIITVNDGTTDNRLMFFYTGTNLIFTVQSSGSTVAILSFNTTTAGIYKLAGAYKQNDFVFYVNGTQAATDTSGNVPVTLTRIDIGTELGFNFLNDRIRAAALYTTRLSNAQLAELTRL